MNKIPSGIKDNYTRGEVGEFLREKIGSGSKLSIVSAYFTIQAYDALKEKLDNIDHLDLLFGDPRSVASVDPKTGAKSFEIPEEDEGMQLRQRLEQKRVAIECEKWLKEKVDIKSIEKDRLIHGKLYHIDNNGIEHAILGSSNFTLNGLGFNPNSNIELNMVVDGDRDKKDLRQWFYEIWNDKALVEDVKADVLREIQRLYENNAPQFIYYKTLYHIFEKFLAEQDRSGLVSKQHHLAETSIWETLFEFQKDGVKGAVNKILAHNGCIIADSVGLGKTYEALAVIKYFELRNDKVLVLCPKKLRDNWTVYQAQNNSELNPFVNDRFGYTVLSHTDLSRDGGKSGDIDLATINWGNYDLVVIDESHNFRNNNKGKRDEEGNIIRRSRYERLMEDIVQSGVKTKVLLLSATPVNTSFIDLRNQIYFLTEGKDEAFGKSLGIHNITETLKNAQRTFSEWAKRKHHEHRTKDLLERLDSAFFKLLDELTIARSRKHLREYYPEVLESFGGFPVRQKPISIYPDIDSKGRFMSYDALNKQILKYQLSLFNPSKYLNPEFRPTYEAKSAWRSVKNFTQEDREHYLIGMMKVNFMKRLESSIRSFQISMERTINKIEDLEKRIHDFKEYQAGKSEIDFDDLSVREDEDEELQTAFQVGKKLLFQLEHLDVDRWLTDLGEDKRQLNVLYSSAKDVTVGRDEKLKTLQNLLEEKIKKPTRTKEGKPNRKALIFTAFADTAFYLYEALQTWAQDELGVHIALVSGGTGGNKTTLGSSKYEEILTNFSPVAKNRKRMPSMPQEDEIDILIATDCISEGQNLQDCDYVVNYDIHWNPVRIIQRFGRVDRIGSINDRIQLVNFWPTDDLNQYIDLRNRVEARMAMVDLAATSEDNILNINEIKELIKEDLTYRDKQLLRLREEVLDFDDLDENVSLTEFTLDDFRMELLNYIESNREALEKAPWGLYAVVPEHPEHEVIKKGVIFCLRQRGDSSGNEKINPLQPYFLVYVRADGTVRYTFTHAKQILEIFRMLCAEKHVPYEALCNVFDRETRNGEDMSFYDGLLVKAVQAIVGTFRKRITHSLFSKRSAILPDQHKQAKSTRDFELITWLVIK